MNTISTSPRPELTSAENRIAALLTIIPGLGHVYKGHYATGLIWMFAGMPVAIWIGILLGLATAGLGLLFPVACWAGLAVGAYYERDLRKHHWLMPESDGTEEEDLFDD